MIGKSSRFFSGVFVGALASSATALLFVLQPGGKTRMQTRETLKAFLSKAEKVRARYMDELGGWSGEGVEIKEISVETLAGGTLGMVLSWCLC